MEISISGRGLLCAFEKLLPLQLRRVMKLTTIFLTVICIHVSARSFEQVVTFNGKNVPLTQVFASIEKQTGMSFFFNYSLIKGCKPVSLELDQVSLEYALRAALENEGLQYYKMGKTLFIVKKQQTSYTSDSRIDVVLVTVEGKVTNSVGETLAAATVTLKNGKNATLTDERGEFELKNVPIGAVLEISYLGYEAKDIVINGSERILVQLSVTHNQLDEAQVIAFGQTSQRLSTSNISTIKGEDLAKQPVNNPLLGLEGMVPGLFITQSNGLPGGGVVTRIQGVNSISKGNDPLIVIDGVPYPSQTLPTVGLMGSPLGNSGGISGNSGAGNPLEYINPSDIESISVLKDADATAIYGSRAANGAILISTKKGKAGHPGGDLNFQQGCGRITRKLNLLNTNRYLLMRHEAKANDGASILSTDYDINGFWDTTRNTDWQKELLGNTAQYTNVNGTISGGNTSFQYLVGSTFHRETTVFPGTSADQKASGHISLSSVSLNEKFRMQLSASYLSDNNQLPLTDLTNSAILMAPDAPTIYNPDGTLNWKVNSSGASTWANPMAGLYQSYQNKTNNLISDLVLSYRLLSGLDIKTNFGYNNIQTNELVQIPLVSYSPQLQQIGSSLRESFQTNNNIHSWVIEPSLNYRKVIGSGKLDFLLGTSIQQNSGAGNCVGATGFNSDAVLGDLLSAANIFIYGTTAYKYKYTGTFGRLNYVWMDKYIVDVTARRDGSSRFGSNNEYHNFGSIGFAWVFTQEHLIKDNLRFLSFGKLRGNIGTTGNDQIGDYGFLNLYKPVAVGTAFQGVTGISPTGLTNPYLQWEETRKIQGGIDLGFVKDRVLFAATYAYNRSSNELGNLPLPYITGYPSIVANLPATVQNTSLELSLNAKILRTRDFEWVARINFTIPKNKLIAYPSLSNSTFVVGQPLYVIKAYHFLGVSPTTGLYQVADIHGNATSSPNPTTDNTSLVNVGFPEYYGGLECSFTYKRLTVDFLCQFVKQKGANYYFGRYPGAFNTNNPTSVLNRWMKAGDIANIQRFNSNNSLNNQFNIGSNSDAHYSDASFIRIKNVSISYQLNSKGQARTGLKGLEIYLQGQNLWTVTSFKGSDPESKSATTLPPIAVLTAGLKINL